MLWDHATFRLQKDPVQIDQSSHTELSAQSFYSYNMADLYFKGSNVV